MIKNSCKFLALLMMISFTSVTTPAFAATAEEEVETLLINVFDAMRAGDAETLKTLILSDTALDRIAPGEAVTRGQSEDWIGWVETLSPGQADEQIFDVEIKVEGPLATAWAPFTIAIDGELKSCGVNHFTLVKQDDGWKVAYLIDTHTPEKCLPQ
jgi:ketosteroid isomerase-like protein